MIEYILQDEYCIGCRMRVARFHCHPEPEDFKSLYFKVNDIIYFEWSPEFAKACDVEHVWSKLKHD